ncbi:hypothetical protein GOP47_0017351 [Adiantum capillus-veneris]|uniref:Uncharacterized protein n=1 Tax=Adiantum capillus-veneris TaxID=13818 RepID=A0A9D4UF50_ADICA|nr:hypothetical protein GOP47_0017351 [Adiantum capillus-veneris]
MTSSKDDAVQVRHWASLCAGNCSYGPACRAFQGALPALWHPTAMQNQSSMQSFHEQHAAPPSPMLCCLHGKRKNKN